MRAIEREESCAFGILAAVTTRRARPGMSTTNGMAQLGSEGLSRRSAHPIAGDSARNANAEEIHASFGASRFLVAKCTDHVRATADVTEAVSKAVGVIALRIAASMHLMNTIARTAVNAGKMNPTAEKRAATATSRADAEMA